MRVGVLIMTTGKEPSLSNNKAMIDTFIADTQRLSDKKLLKNEYDYIFYSYRDDIESRMILKEATYYRMFLKGDESVYRTYEKSYEAFEYAVEKFDYDWYVRINISNFLNIRLLDRMLSHFDENCIYCNAINAIVNMDSEYANELYARGDFMIFSRKMMKGILDNGKEFINCDMDMKHRIEVTHVDDCLIGLAVMKYLGDEYFMNLKMLKYNYLSDMNVDNADICAISSRVKTNPPGVNYSGYSWEDNEYRRRDGVKMHQLNDMFRLSDYGKIKFEDLFPDKASMRPILLVNGVSANFEDVKNLYIEKSRK